MSGSPTCFAAVGVILLLTVSNVVLLVKYKQTQSNADTGPELEASDPWPTLTTTVAPSQKSFKSLAAVSLTGFTGLYAEKINGIYLRTARNSSQGKPVFGSFDGRTCLLYDNLARWLVTDCVDDTSGTLAESSIYAVTNETNLRNPTLAQHWFVPGDGTRILQPDVEAIELTSADLVSTCAVLYLYSVFSTSLISKLFVVELQKL
jgi:hypothetical protein